MENTIIATDNDNEHNLDPNLPQDQQQHLTYKGQKTYEHRFAAPVMHGRMTGKVKFFNSTKGKNV